MVDEIKKILQTDEKTAKIIENMCKFAIKLDESVKIDLREEIVGVGRPDEILRFYFVNKKGNVFVKFKISNSSLRVDELKQEDAERIIENTNLVFSQGDFKRKKERPSETGRKINMSRFEYLCKLAEGVDPVTGELLFKNNQPIKMALLSIAGFVYKHDKTSIKSFVSLASEAELNDVMAKVETKREAFEEKLGNMGHSWTKEEDETLKTEFKKGINIEEIASLHRRTKSAIERRLIKLVPINEYMGEGNITVKP